MDNKSKKKYRWFKYIIYLLAIIFIPLLVISYFGLYVYELFYDNTWIIDNLKEHYAATIGLPFAAVAASLIVLVFETKSGEIKITIWNMKFEGTSGEIIMWVLVFISEGLMIALLW
jgi:hypothetical protein